MVDALFLRGNKSVPEALGSDKPAALKEEVSRRDSGESLESVPYLGELKEILRGSLEAALSLHFSLFGRGFAITKYSIIF